jgi:hypothetical protein
MDQRIEIKNTFFQNNNNEDKITEMIERLGVNRLNSETSVYHLEPIL